MASMYYRKKIAFHICVLALPLVVTMFWPLLLLARHFKAIGDVYCKVCFELFSVFGDPLRAPKSELFRHLKEEKATGSRHGLRILEVGPGTGANFRFYPPNSLVATVEKNPRFEGHLRKAKDKYADIRFVRLVTGSAEDMSDVADRSVDVVVATDVICCVKSRETLFREIARVLGRGGKLYFVEYVSHAEDAPAYKRLMQSLYSPFWKLFMMDCRAGGQDMDQILAEANFLCVHRRRYELSELPLTHSSVMAGIAVRSL